MPIPRPGEENHHEQAARVRLDKNNAAALPDYRNLMTSYAARQDKGNQGDPAGMCFGALRYDHAGHRRDA